MGLALDLEDYHPSVLLHCCLGHLTCKIVSEMTYNVSSWTLNPTILSLVTASVTNEVFEIYPDSPAEKYPEEIEDYTYS